MPMSRLHERYQKEVLPWLQKEMGYPNRMAAPRLVKIVLNMGIGEAIQNIKALDAAAAELGQITGQKDRKSTRLNSSHIQKSRMPSSA